MFKAAITSTNITLEIKSGCVLTNSGNYLSNELQNLAIMTIESSGIRASYSAPALRDPTLCSIERHSARF